MTMAFWWHLTHVLVPLVAATGETWHMVDLAAVVCPKPTNLKAGAETLPEYNVGIDMSGLSKDKPHIVSFVRASDQATTITFKIEDANGLNVVPETTVTLQAVSSSVPSACQCTNPSIPTAVTSTYGAGYGSSCAAWDEPKCGDLWGNLTVGAWCCRPWCYASKECPDAYSSQAIPGQFFSYAACNACKYDNACDCRGVLPSGSFNNIDSGATIPANYGSQCDAWDNKNCKEMWIQNPNAGWNTTDDKEWCCDSWCYVNNSCPIAKQSWFGIDFKYSYQTCDDNPDWTYQASGDTCGAHRRRSSNFRELGGRERCWGLSLRHGIVTDEVKLQFSGLAQGRCVPPKADL
eukprot:g8819.t1